MAHRLVTDTSILPRMARDVARHSKRVREAIRKNIARVVANEQIITADKGKIIRISIPLLKEWHISLDGRYSVHVGHGDGLERTKCPGCGGRGCKLCNELGLVSKKRATRIKRWLEVIDRGPDGIAVQMMPSTMDDDLRQELPQPHDPDNMGRQSKTGKPRSKAGDRLHREKKGGGGDGDGDQAGNGEEGGEIPGMEAYEAEITVGDVEDIVFEQLGLPNLEDRGSRKITKESFRFDEIRHIGPLASIDKRRSIKENMIRNAKEIGKACVGAFDRRDLRFRTYEVEEDEETAAVVFALMDVSGSMDEHKKFLARTFYAWMLRFLRTQYDNVEIVFISHHTEANECTEEDFFHRVESGGTFMSSAWTKALEIMNARYPASDWNVYVFHFSDGYNWSSDNDNLVDSINDVLAYPANMVGYGEIHAEANPSWVLRLPKWARPTGVIDLLSKVFKDEKRFVSCRVDQETDVWPALQTFFSGDAHESIRKAVR